LLNKKSQLAIGVGVAYMGIANLAFMVSAYLTNVVLGRSLGPALYGTYGILTSLMTVVNLMQVSGVAQAESRFVAESGDNGDSVLWSSIKLQLILTVSAGVLFAMLAPWTGVWFHDPALAGYARVMALVFPIYGVFAIYAGYYNGRRDWRRQAIMNIVYAGAKLLLVVGLGLVWAIFGVVVGFVLAPLVALSVGWRFPKPSTSFPIRKLWAYAIPLICLALVSTLQLSIDLFGVKALVHNPTAAGYYTAAQNIALIVFLSLNALGQVMLPSVSQYLAVNDHAMTRRIISKSLRWFWLLICPLAAFVIGGAPDLVQLLYGSAYESSVISLRVLAVGYVPLALFSLMANILNGAGRAKSSLVWGLVGLSTTAITCSLLIPSIGLAGAAMATTLGALMSALGAGSYAWRRLNFTWKVSTLIRASSGAVGATVVCLLWPVPAILIPAKWLAFIALYGGWLLLTREFERPELMKMWQHFRRFGNYLHPGAE
jgi:stage V sporulation protein B